MKKIVLSLNLLSISFLQAGVIISLDIPQESLETVMKSAQETTTKVIDELGQQNNIAILFSPSEYLPHISLAFVSPDKIDNKQLKERYARLLPALAKVASNHKQLEIPASKGEINLWPGKFEMPCGGSKKKNYINVVYALAATEVLKNVAEDVQSQLKELFEIEQRFPFSAHLTLGRICEKDDTPIPTHVLNDLKSKLDESIPQYLEEAPNLSVQRFSLKSDDKEIDEELIFTLSK